MSKKVPGSNCRDPENRSDKDCCCGGHNQNKRKHKDRKLIDRRKRRKQKQIDRFEGP